MCKATLYGSDFKQTELKSLKNFFETTKANGIDKATRSTSTQIEQPLEKKHLAPSKSSVNIKRSRGESRFTVHYAFL